MQPTDNSQVMHGSQETGFHPVFSGVLKRTKDIRDFKLGRVQAPVQRPASYMPAEFFAMNSVSQGRQPDCGGASGMNLLQLKRFYQKLVTAYENLSMRFLYAYEKSVDGYAGTDGTTIKAIGQALTTAGSSREELCQNDTLLSFTDFSNWNAVTPEAKADALPRKFSSYAFLENPTMESIKQAIFQNQAVILQVRLGNEWWTAANGSASYLEKDICPMRPPKPIVSGHFVVAGAYDENYIYFINSFGTSWGRNGFGYFGANYMPYVIEGLTIMDVAPEVLTPQQYTWFENILINIQTALNSISAQISQKVAKK